MRLRCHIFQVKMTIMSLKLEIYSELRRHDQKGVKCGPQRGVVYNLKGRGAMGDIDKHKV
jgi:hypothetical protein